MDSMLTAYLMGYPYSKEGIFYFVKNKKQNKYNCKGIPKNRLKENNLNTKKLFYPESYVYLISSRMKKCIVEGGVYLNM